jgi:hypothetical protein
LHHDPFSVFFIILKQPKGAQMRRAFALLLYWTFVAPAAAQAVLPTPSAGAVVKYKSGSTDIVRESSDGTFIVEQWNGESLTVATYHGWQFNSKNEYHKCNTQLSECSLGRTGSAEVDEVEKIVHWSPRYPGEELVYNYIVVTDGTPTDVTGEMTLTYGGQEIVRVGAGSFDTHVLIKSWVLIDAKDGTRRSGTSTWWIDQATGIRVRREVTDLTPGKSGSTFREDATSVQVQ